MVHTYTLARLEVSRSAFNEIKEKLEQAGYQHVFMDDGGMDMTHIAIAAEEGETSTCENCGATVPEDEIQKCDHCDHDGLGNCCIGQEDHDCDCEDTE